MSLFLETIRISNRKIRNLEYHNRRFNDTRLAIYSGDEEDLSTLIKIPDDLGSGIFRCRVVYRREIEKVEFIPHRPRIIKSLKLVHSDEIDYSYKFADRTRLESLLERKGDCDEILIVKNGYITDTSISNIIFRKKDGSWVTPDTPLLRGTMREYLLESGRISESRVRPADLSGFTAAKMINCMMDPEESPALKMNLIKT